MKNPVIIDTNVPIVANGKNTHADLKCIESCVDTLIAVQQVNKVLVDHSGFILDEYSDYLSFKGQPGVGDAFFKWLWDNQANPEVCIQVDISSDDEDGNEFSIFPDDPDLEKFDRSDRKFVAVALTSGVNPPILNATDSDWFHFLAAFGKHGVVIEFICPHLMK